MLHKLSRWYNRIYAGWIGYFWLRCPCGEMFGGHECAPTGLMMGWSHGQNVCQGCDAEAQKRNADWIEQNPFPVTWGHLVYSFHADESVRALYNISGR